MSSPDIPRFAVPLETLVPVNPYPAEQFEIPPSRMFVIKLSLKKYIEKIGDNAVTFDASQGDGGASLPGVAPEVLDRAHEIVKQKGTGYDFPYGANEFREMVVEQYWQLDPSLGWGPVSALFTVGGRDALIKAYTAMVTLGTGRVGDAILTSRVPWISYNWGPYAIGANVLHAPGHEDNAWKYTPEGIRAAVAFAQARGGRQVAGIVITSPDNPTGHTIPMEDQIALGKVALEAGVKYVLYDWIYHYVSEGPPSDANVLLAAFTPEERRRIMIMDGITKCMGASNIRSAHLLGDPDVIKFISSRASHSVIPHIHGQAVAMAAYEMGLKKAAANVIEPTNASREVLRAFLSANNYQFIMGDGGYYAFINVAKWMEAGGYEDSFELGAYLAEDHGIAVVPGGAFSEDGDRWIRFSYALPPEVTQGAVERMHGALAALE